MNRTTLKQELRRAIEDGNALEVGRVVDFMRFRLSLNYTECFQIAHELTGICQPSWDALLYQADLEESR